MQQPVRNSKGIEDLKISQMVLHTTLIAERKKLKTMASNWVLHI